MEYLSALIIVVLVSILMYKQEIVKEPLSFEPGEKFTKRNKWLVWYEFTMILTTLNDLINIFKSPDLFNLILNLIDLALVGTFTYLLLSRNSFSLKMVFYIITLQTLSMTITASDNYGDVSSMFTFAGIYIACWLAPNYIYFAKRRNLFNELNATETLENIATQTIEEMEEDASEAIRLGDLELAQTIAERINEAKKLQKTVKSKESFKKIAYEVCFSLACVLGVILSIGASVFYIYTLYVYFTEYGFWQGTLSFVLPIISTIFLCIQKWIEEGIDNIVTTLGLIWLSGLGITLIFYGLSCCLKNNDDE